MDPKSYLPAYFFNEYLRTHPDLTPAARELLQSEIQEDPEPFVQSDHAKTLLAYAHLHHYMISQLEKMNGLEDDDYERKRNEMLLSVRQELQSMAQYDRLAIDARLTLILLSEFSFSSVTSSILKLEQESHDYLKHAVDGFSDDAPHFWEERVLKERNASAAELTLACPEMIGWLHTLDTLAIVCLISARYQAAATYARIVMRAQGFVNNAQGTLLLALARLERHDEFFDVVSAAENASEPHPFGPIDASPWYLLGRTILLYRAGNMRAARRAIKEFSERCEGGAYFVLNPTTITPYLPDRPLVAPGWKQSHQATWEADAILGNCLDFTMWASKVEGVTEAAAAFCKKYGFE